MGIPHEHWHNREVGVMPQTCHCGCQQFRVTRPNLDKDLLAVRCAACGAFYGYLIPDIGESGRWRVVYQN
jgi:hypothetical protein